MSIMRSVGGEFRAESGDGSSKNRMRESILISVGYKIEASRRSLTAIFVNPTNVSFDPHSEFQLLNVK